VVEHLAADSALFVLALADDDPEKRAALAHARECQSCQALLDEGRSMLQLFDAATREDALAAGSRVNAAFESRVRAAVHASEPARKPRLAKFGLLIGALASLAMLFFDADFARPLQAGIGVRCFFYEQQFALLAFGAGVAVGRRYLAQFGAWQSAFAAMGGALLGQALLHTRCEADGAALHLLFFHVGGVLVASLLGGLAGSLLPKKIARHA
jgi:hypothetical protein